jgi:hypothetical protein
MVLFSAAHPGQGGINHKNEQKISFWAKKFIRHKFVCFDFIRPKIHANGNVKAWYRENAILFISIEKLSKMEINTQLRLLSF